MTDAVLVACFILGLGLVAAAGWYISPSLGLLITGAAMAIVPILYVRGRRLSGDE